MEENGCGTNECKKKTVKLQRNIAGEFPWHRNVQSCFSTVLWIVVRIFSTYHFQQSLIVDQFLEDSAWKKYQINKKQFLMVAANIQEGNEIKGVNTDSKGQQRGSKGVNTDSWQEKVFNYSNNGAVEYRMRLKNQTADKLHYMLNINTTTGNFLDNKQAVNKGCCDFQQRLQCLVYHIPHKSTYILPITSFMRIKNSVW